MNHLSHKILLKDYEITLDLLKWLRKHIGKEFDDWGFILIPNFTTKGELLIDEDIKFLFKNEKDALLFKLIWG